MATLQYRQDRRHTTSFVKYAMSIPLLAREEELALARRWRNEKDEDALHRLVEAYMRLVISMAGKFRNYGLATSDLIHEGMVGLMQAAERFEPERNIRFSTYAGWWIRSTIQDFVLRNWSIVRTGTTAAHKALFFRLRRTQRELENYIDGPMSADQRLEVAEKLKVRECDVTTMEARLAIKDRSLNMRLNDQEETAPEWVDSLPDEAPLPDETVMSTRDGAHMRRILIEALSHLDGRERTIIERRLLRDEAETLSEIGETLGISKERVRQVEQEALGKMRDFLSHKMGKAISTQDFLH